MIANIIQGKGNVHSTPQAAIVQIQLEPGQQIPPHDHKGQTVYFTPVLGELRVTINQTETHTLTPGVVLTIPGDAMVAIQAIKESQAFIYLITN